MLARPILTLPCIFVEDYVFSASGRHKRGRPDFRRGLYFFSPLAIGSIILDQCYRREKDPARAAEQRPR
jgi:hypothetical protein